VTITTRRRQLLPDDHRIAVIPIESAANEYVELSVRDTGSGMDLATQARIFDPFYTTKFTGRGLGLSAVLGIVGGHGGTITLRSAPGLGTCFSVLLPAASNTTKLRAARMIDQIGRGSGTILIVDDEPAVREVARCALEGNGYQVLLAGDGLAAIQQVTEHPKSARFCWTSLCQRCAATWQHPAYARCGRSCQSCYPAATLNARRIKLSRKPSVPHSYRNRTPPGCCSIA
jgi:hypothetical protein